MRRFFRDADWLTVQRLRLYGGALLVISVAITVSAWLQKGWPAGQPGAVPPDFVCFWAAGRMVLDGLAPAAYDWTALTQVQNGAVGYAFPESYPWVYPPTFLLVVAPLALLPFAPAFLLWCGATLALWLGTVRLILPHRIAPLVAAALPATLWNVASGQNGFLTAALLGGALALLERRPAMAGFLIGLLTIKPHFGLLLPFALLAAGSWRAILSAILTALGLAAISLALFGVEAWAMFLDSTQLASQALAGGWVGWQELHSVFAAAHILGGGGAVPAALHGIVAVGAGVAVVRTWRRSVPYPVKAAALAAGTLLVTPYVLAYDLVLLSVAGAFLVRQGLADGFQPWERLGITVALLLPLVAFWTPIPPGPVAAGILLVLALRRAGARARLGARSLAAST